MSVHVKAVESWNVGPQGRKVSQIKIAVRVAAGKVGPKGQRPGTFQGATNFRQR